MYVEKPYPLDRPEIDHAWEEAARALGLRVCRTDAAYASSDGKGALFIGRKETLDNADSVAQLILHEICHALVQGDENWTRPDWGLDNTSDRDDGRERACLRLQAHLADQVGLRALMVPTTEWCDYYRKLPQDPFAPLPDTHETFAADVCALAQAGAQRAARAETSMALGQALAATAALLGQDRHPTGFAFGPMDETCGTCAWAYKGGRGPAVDRCRQSADRDLDTKRIELNSRACERWEPAVSCDDCGACCREAYHVVSVAVRDPVVWRHPDLIVRNGHRFSVLRDGEKCAALQVAGGAGGAQAFACKIYEDRPQTCRDFERGGRNCLTARRRVGKSR